MLFYRCKLPLDFIDYYPIVTTERSQPHFIDEEAESKKSEVEVDA